jgi:tryptophan synthase alpha chain
MNQIDHTFQQLRSAGHRAFIPFVTAGDPDLDTTAALVRELSARGASLIEIGVPYSDPIADGPVIQASYTRVLERGVRLAEILDMAARLTASAPAGSIAPLVAMVSYSIVYRHGPERFVADARAAGFSGAIVPDLPVDEAAELAAVAARHDFKLILLVTPTTPRERAVEIARLSTGFIYFVAVVGITGERASIAASVADEVRWLKQQTTTPVCIGFGISTPDHVRSLAAVADGVIVGSAIVRRIAEGAAKPTAHVVREIGDYAATLTAALNVDGARVRP